MLRAGCRLAWTGGPGWRAWREGLVSGGGLDCLAVGPRRSGAGRVASPVRPGCGRLRGLPRHLAAAPAFTDVLGYGPAFRDDLLGFCCSALVAVGVADHVRHAAVEHGPGAFGEVPGDDAAGLQVGGAALGHL